MTHEITSQFEGHFMDSNMPWMKILNQDETAHADEFRWMRELFIAPGVEADTLNFTVTLYKKEPRELPPLHMGDAGGGLNLTRDQVKVVAAACLMFLNATDPEIN